MTTYIIVDKLTGKETAFDGNYCEALDYAAYALNIPEGKYVSDYAEVLTSEEYADEYGDDEYTDEYGDGE